MNWPLIAAGSLSLTAALIHGVVGDRIVRRIDEGVLPGNPFTGLSTMLLIRVSWHFVTIGFFVLGIALVLAGVRPSLAAAQGVAYVAGGAFGCWTIFALVAGISRAGLRSFSSHPAPVIFLLTLALIFWGAARL